MIDKRIGVVCDPLSPRVRHAHDHKRRNSILQNQKGYQAENKKWTDDCYDGNRDGSCYEIGAEAGYNLKIVAPIDALLAQPLQLIGLLHHLVTAPAR